MLTAAREDTQHDPVDAGRVPRRSHARARSATRCARSGASTGSLRASERHVTDRQPRTVGVEEEFVLVDPRTRRATARADRAEAANDSGEEVALELFQSPGRVVHASAARRRRARRGSAPGTTGDGGGSRRDRCACRRDGLATSGARGRGVHEGTALPALRERVRPDRPRRPCVRDARPRRASRTTHEGIRVIDAIRPWLPLLTAMSANSPYWQGIDTGYASWRSRVWERWSSAGPREPFGDLATYREVAGRAIDWGGAMDPAMLYFDVRLSEAYPTVELRVCDVCLEVEDALLVAVLARALVESCADQDPDAWRADLLRVAAWRAARYGLGDDLVHPVRRELAPPREVFAALLDHVGTGSRALRGTPVRRGRLRAVARTRQRRRPATSYLRGDP